MFCYIKYSAFLVNSLHTVKRDLSSESDPRRGKPKQSTSNARPGKFVSCSEANPEPEPFSLTNQLVYKMSMALVKQKNIANEQIEQVPKQTVVNRPDSNNRMSVVNIPLKREKKTTLTISSPNYAKSRISFTRLQSIKLKTAYKPLENRNDTVMINSDCYVQILIDYVHELLDIDKHVNVDLCDESGTMLRLQELKPHESAMSRLEARKTYNLMSIEWDPVKLQYIAVTPLISPITPKDTDLIQKLSRYPSVNISDTPTTAKLKMKKKFSLNV